MQEIKGKIKVVAAALAGGLMLGATMAGAVAANLGNLPAPFVQNHQMNAQIVIGANAAVADVIAAAQVAAALGENMVSAATTGGTTTTTGGRTEDALMGKKLTYTGQFPTTMKKTHISTLDEGKVTFQSTDYDYREELVLGNTAKILTGQDDRDKDYDTTKAFLEVKKGDVEYKLNFYGTSKPIVNASSTSDPLEVTVLGHDLKIVGASPSDQSITAEVGTKLNALHIGDSATVAGKTLTVDDIGSGSVAVSVDGVSSVISTGATKTVNGIKVKVDNLIYHTNEPSTSTVYLIAGNEVTKTYESGSEFIGENEDDPIWVWDISIDSSTGALNYLGVKYNKDVDNYQDGPKMVGEKFELPNDYLEIQLNSMTPEADRQYTLSIETGVDLYSSDGSTSIATGKNVIRIYSTSDNAFTDGTHDTKDLALYLYKDRYAGNATEDVISIYYKDGAKYKFAKNMTYGNVTTQTNSTGWYLQYGDTLPYIKLQNNGPNVGVIFDFDGISSATDVDSNIIANVTIASGAFDHLGATDDQADAADVILDTAKVGTFDGTLLTHYGALLYNIKNNADNDEVVFKIPNAQTKVSVFIGSPSGGSSTSGSSTTYTYAPITTEVAVMDIEASTSQPMIIVGGPGINSLAQQLLGSRETSYESWKTFFGYDETSGTGKGVIKVYDAADTPWSQPALLIAGWEAKDTRAAGYIFAKYLTQSKVSEWASKTKVVVSGETVTGATVSSTE